MREKIKIIFIIAILFIIFLPASKPTEQAYKKTENQTALKNIWNIREDLQFYFPNGVNGVKDMKGWTLNQWAEEIGYKEYKSLRVYNEEIRKQDEKNYIYNKYLPIETALKKIAEREYILNEYDCKHFSADLKAELAKEDISSIMITGFLGKDGHRWLAIEFEPITGNIVGTDRYNSQYPKQKLTKNYYEN